MTYPGQIEPRADSLGMLVGNPNLGVRFSNWLADILTDAQQGIDGNVPSSDQNPMAAMQYMFNKRDVIVKSAQQRPMVRLADKHLTIKAELYGEMSCEYEELAMDSGSAKYIVRYDNWIVDHMINQIRADEDLHLIIDPIPTQRNWRTRWGGKVHTINIVKHEDGTSTVELQAISMREHSKRLLIACNPIFAPEVQLPKMWILPGPLRTVLFATFFINLARLFVPGLSFITNAFNPVSWLNPLGGQSLFNINPLHWPIQVAFVNPLKDQSRWTVLGAQWTDWHSATTDLLKDAGCIMRAYTWLDEDEDSPHTELQEMIDLLPGEGIIEDVLTKVIRPQRNCVVFGLEDWSGHEGPTGTPIDGILNVVGVTLDDLLTSIFVDAETGLRVDNDEPFFDPDNEFPLFQKLLGVAPKPPKVVWRDSHFSAIINSQQTIHKAPTRTYMTGSRSPAIVNELQTFGIKYGLSQLSTMINGAIGTFVNTAYETPGTPGLEEIYQGQLDNSLFAWQRLTDPVIAIWSGDLAYQEWLERGSGTAYTMAGLLTLREARYKMRAYRAFKATVKNGAPWLLDSDVRLGERAGWEFDDIIYVDQIMALRRGWDRQRPILSTVSVGDDQDQEDLFARGMRVLQAVYSLVGAVLGEGTVFG